MHVRELMRTDVCTIAADATVAEAIQVMADARVSGMPVVSQAGIVIGVLSTTDILEAEAEHEDRRARTELFENTTVQDLMTPGAIVVSPGDRVRDAAKLMVQQGIHRVFVVDGTQLVGVLSQTDITRAFGTGRL